jgi:hypothetical protein
VRVEVHGDMGDLSACHCDMCTRWSGSVQMGIEVPEAHATVTGPIKTYRSSWFAERAWCDDCGSALWLRNVDGPETGDYEFVPGLFDNAAGKKLVRVVYADRHPDGFWLDGASVTRVSRKAYEAGHPHLNEETTP